jgi:hypothetical protein
MDEDVKSLQLENADMSMKEAGLFKQRMSRTKRRWMKQSKKKSKQKRQLNGRG